MTRDIEDFPLINGSIKGQLAHLRSIISIFVSNETARNHMFRTINEISRLNEHTYGIVQAHRYPTIAKDLLEIHLKSN